MIDLKRRAAFCIGIGMSLLMTACGGGGGTTTPPTTTYTLTVNSTNPTSGVAITVSAADNNSATDGSTSFTRIYNSGTSVTLTAPGTSGGNSFNSWTGCTSASTVTCTVTMNANTTVTANYTAPPAITSFAASPATIASGASADLTAVFANGTGVITPGDLTVTSGAPASVSPTATTTYTLTVTPSSGTAITQTVTVTVASATIAVQATLGAAVTDQILGMNLAAWTDVASSTAAPIVIDAFQTAGIKAVRWPGGSWSDAYNWETNTECGNTANSSDDFTDFVNNLILPAGLDLALTADYGTGKNCTGAGDPTEAAAWVTEAKALGVTVSYMTVGNEEYGTWETDNHTLANDPATYAAATKTGYYPDIKAANANTLVGVSVNPGNSPAWDPTVLKNAAGYYDFVEYHYYPEAPGYENDTTLVQQDAQQLTTNINTIKSELATAGEPNTPIYVGEIGSVYTLPGKQSSSITQALYAGQILGEMMNDGVARATWWLGFGGCDDPTSYRTLSNGTKQYANFDTTGLTYQTDVYGWQNFGGYMVFSDGLPEYGCYNATLAEGVLLPTARAYQLFSKVAVTGEHVLTANVTGDTKDVVAYAATHSSGKALVLFNRNKTTSEPVVITLSGQTTATTVTVETYDKAIYDQSGPSGNSANPLGTSTWAPPTTSTITSPTLPLTLTLTPWSMNVVIIK